MVFLQLKNFVKLVAWKMHQRQSRDKMLAALCHRSDFDSLLKLFMAGAILAHDDLHVVLFTSECCIMMVMMMMMLMMLMMMIDDDLADVG